MANSDPTPDFSWLNKIDEKTEQQEPLESGEPEKTSETQESEAVDEAAESPVVTADSVTENTAEDEVSDDDGESGNFAAETWVPESPELVKPDNPADELPASQSSALAEGESESVFDDDSDGNEMPRDSDSSNPTLIMPGRTLSESESAALNSSQADDMTVVLPPDPMMTNDQVVTEESSVAEGSEESTPEDEPAAEENVSLESPTIPGMVVSNSETTSHSETDTDDSAKPSEPATDAAAASDPEKKNNLGLVLLASYASAITLIALFLLMRGSGSGDAKHLESLPDVAPEAESELTYVPVNAKLPPGHTLTIGEKRRFGNIEVEPLEVVYEPIEFIHYSPTSKLTRSPSEPVYKLRVRFTNVSEDQQIAPLDGRILLRWVMKTEQQREYSNQYLFVDGQDASAPEIPIYRHSRTSDWDLKDQNLGKVLAPGESYVTFVPSAENVEDMLAGKLNWRMQFRKGFSSKGNGVTTIVDVAFDSQDVKKEVGSSEAAG